MGLRSFEFDDALMFYRYAMNLRHGYGLAWNPGEGPLYGLTSLPWGLLVWCVSFLPLPPVAGLVLLSSATGLLALVALSWLCWRQLGRSSAQDLLVLFPLIGLPLLCQRRFTDNLTNGMETMLAMLVVTLFVGVALWSTRKANLWGAVALAAMGELLALIRPEALLVALLLPACLLLVQRHTRTVRFLVCYLTTLAGLIGVTLLANKFYFGSPVPLPVYLKWLHAYKGYRLYLNPFAYTAYFLSLGSLPLLVVASLARRRHLPMLAAFWVPLGAVVFYLSTVTQIMGLNARYYVPFLPLLYVPAAYITGDRLAREGQLKTNLSPRRIGLVACAVLLTGTQFTETLYVPLANLITRGRMVYPLPEFQTTASVDLPVLQWWTSCNAVGEIARTLPPGSLISASEVGMLGVLAPQVRILDSVGLNDAHIAHHGFDPEYILSRKPELIWMIHSDYTEDYGRLASDPRLLQEYTVYAGAFQYGLAIRKDSPHRAMLTEALARQWNRYYAGYDASRYVVQGVTWNATPVRHSPRFAVMAP